MSHLDDLIGPLREALEQSPENVALRRHIASLLLKHGQPEQAAEEYRAALGYDSTDVQIKLGLARCYQQLGKVSMALVIAEELLGQSNTPPEVYLLHARLLLRTGELEQARHQYMRAIDLDPALADPTLAEQLGAVASEGWTDSDDEEDDDFDDIPFGDERDRDRERTGPTGDPIKIEKPKINFDDVGGMEDLKEQIRVKIIHPLQHPEIYKAYGKAIGGGMLLYGPPGCGKTHIARATAGQVEAKFMPVGIHDVLEMWIGQSEQKLHALFENARQSNPTVLFFDEVDALGASRTDMKQSAGRQLINQFLSELDGVQDSNDGMLILAATNAPWHLDNAFRRPGRFDRVLFVPPPDAEARAEILRILLKDKPVQDIDHASIAGKCEHFSGADLKAVVDIAIEAKLADAMKQGVPKPLTTKDLVKAAGKHKPTTREWFATARNYALYSNEGGIYDDILQYLNL